MPASAPTTEIGYTQPTSYNWWLYENETTPELIWPQSVFVYDQMRRTDSQVGSILRAVTLLVLRTPWRIDPNGARPEVVELVADDLGLPIVGQGPKAPQRTKDRFSWSQHLQEALLMLPLGHSYFEQVYRVDDDGKRAHLRKLALRPAKSIERIDVAPDGGLISITQWWTAGGKPVVPIPVDRLVGYIHAKEGGNWLGTSILRNCYKNWLLKDRLLRVQAQTIERNGMGIPLYTGQEDASEADLEAGKAMAKAWRAGEAAGSSIPYGATLKLVGVEGTLPDAEPAIRYHDESIAKTVLAHFLNLGQQMGTGSYALGTTLGDFFTLGVQTVAQQIADIANQHAVEDLVDVNWGPNEPAPRIVFDEIGSRQAATAAAIKTLVDAGVIEADAVLEQSTRQQYGLPPKDEGTVRQPPNAAATAPDQAQFAQSVAAAAGGEVPAADVDDEDLDDLDDDDAVDVLVIAMAEFAGEVVDDPSAVLAAVWNPSLHARYPKGHPLAGKFRPMVDRLVEALKNHAKSGGKGDPFHGFSREQLRRAAVTRGLTLKRNASRDDIRDLLVADLSPAGGHQAPKVATPAVPSPAAPSSAPARAVPLSVAGIGGVTSTKVPVPANLLPTPTMNGAKQSQEIHVGGVHIGTVHQYTGSLGWLADSPAGNRLTSVSVQTRAHAIQALVNAHLAKQAAPSAATLQTSVPGVTLSQAPTLSSSPGAVSLDVDLNGTGVGAVHNAGGAGTGGWTAFPPTGASYGLGTNPGSGQTFSVRDDAVRALVDAHNRHAPAPAGTGVPGVTTRPMPGMSQSTMTYLMVSHGGVDIGEVYDNALGWVAFDANRASVFGPNGSHIFASKDSALKAILDAHLGQTAPKVPTATPTPAPTAPDPAVRAAQDVLYGLDPKAKTAARQLAVYGDLKRSHFDSLDSAERSTLMGDLAYIAASSKGPNADRAKKLIDRFTPPGTPLGTIPPQAVIPPAGAVSAQTRVADPAGTGGLLKMKPKGQRGSSGDGWTTGSNGRRGPWGQYGAAGLMLRHVDSAGVERFLMVQRGPAISDPGKWQFPGGAKEELEDFYQGAAREVIEELGFKPSDLDAARVHGTHTAEVASVSVPGMHGGTVPWAYVSVAATVPTQLQPDLSTPHARAETSDAKWMTAAEIARLDQGGKLLTPLAGGALQQNVMTLFPSSPAARPGARTSRPPRLTGQPAAPVARHKPSKGRDLISDRAAQDHLRAEVSKVRKNYRGKTADERLAAIGAMQGYDDTPTVVSKAEMDRLLATGDYIETWRGIEGTQHSWRAPRGGPHKTAAQIHEEMRSGPAYYGTGVYGNGYYLTTRKSVAEQYSDKTKNSVVRVLIPKTAKTDDIDSIEAGARRASSSGPTGVHTSRTGDKGGGTLRNPGRYAAAKGLDGIEILHTSRPAGGHPGHITRPGQPAYTWVNRSVLIVQEAEK